MHRALLTGTEYSGNGPREVRNSSSRASRMLWRARPATRIHASERGAGLLACDLPPGPTRARHLGASRQAHPRSCPSQAGGGQAHGREAQPRGGHAVRGACPARAAPARRVPDRCLSTAVRLPRRGERGGRRTPQRLAHAPRADRGAAAGTSYQRLLPAPSQVRRRRIPACAGRDVQAHRAHPAVRDSDDIRARARDRALWPGSEPQSCDSHERPTSIRRVVGSTRAPRQRLPVVGAGGGRDLVPQHSCAARIRSRSE
jgi:hypothetical protein